MYRATRPRQVRRHDQNIIGREVEFR